MPRALKILIPTGIFVLGCTLLVVFAIFELWTNNRHAREKLESHVVVVGTALASAMETAARRGSLEEASISFEQTRGDRRLVASVVVDENDRIAFASRLRLRGRRLADSGLGEAAPLLVRARNRLRGQVEQARDRETILSVFPIRLAPRDDEFVASRVGALVMRHSLRRDRSWALASAGNQVTILGLVLAAMSVLVWLFCNRTLARPIHALVEAADGLAAGHKVPVLSGLAGTAEIEHLARAFDDMAAALERRTDALEESHAFMYATMDALPSHVAVLNEEGTIIAVNQAWRSFGDENGLALPGHGVGVSYIAHCEEASGERTEEGRHVAGDELLRQVAQAISGQVRSGDSLARLGGDEFGFLIEHCPLDQGVARAEAIRAAVEECRFAWEENVFSLGASIGVAGLDFVLARLDESGAPADRLGFEVTETAAISNLTRATRFMERLADRGCRFALDDFGSGLSSFAYLKHLPVDLLKIDGVFVRDIANDPIDAAMVRSINEIGHVMGKQTVAEYVEDEATLEHLRKIGVDFAQGYAVHRPEPLADLPNRDVPLRHDRAAVRN